MEIVYSDKAVKQLKQLYKSQKSIAQLIINKILSIKSENSDIKILKGKLGNISRLRVGNYRVLFVQELDLIKILEINHRKEVYRDN